MVVQVAKILIERVSLFMERGRGADASELNSCATTLFKVRINSFNLNYVKWLKSLLAFVMIF